MRVPIEYSLWDTPILEDKYFTSFRELESEALRNRIHDLTREISNIDDSISSLEASIAELDSQIQKETKAKNVLTNNRENAIRRMKVLQISHMTELAKRANRRRQEAELDALRKERDDCQSQFDSQNEKINKINFSKKELQAVVKYTAKKRKEKLEEKEKVKKDLLVIKVKNLSKSRGESGLWKEISTHASDLPFLEKVLAEVNEDSILDEVDMLYFIANSNRVSKTDKAIKLIAKWSTRTKIPHWDSLKNYFAVPSQISITKVTPDIIDRWMLGDRKIQYRGKLLTLKDLVSVLRVTANTRAVSDDLDFGNAMSKGHLIEKVRSLESIRDILRNHLIQDDADDVQGRVEAVERELDQNRDLLNDSYKEQQTPKTQRAKQSWNPFAVFSRKSNKVLPSV